MFKNVKALSAIFNVNFFFLFSCYFFVSSSYLFLMTLLFNIHRRLCLSQYCLMLVICHFRCDKELLCHHSTERTLNAHWTHNLRWKKREYWERRKSAATAIPILHLSTKSIDFCIVSINTFIKRYTKNTKYIFIKSSKSASKEKNKIRLLSLCVMISSHYLCITYNKM